MKEKKAGQKIRLKNNLGLYFEKAPPKFAFFKKKKKKKEEEIA